VGPRLAPGSFSGWLPLGRACPGWAYLGRSVPISVTTNCCEERRSAGVTNLIPTRARKARHVGIPGFARAIRIYIFRCTCATTVWQNCLHSSFSYDMYVISLIHLANTQVIKFIIHAPLLTGKSTSPGPHLAIASVCAAYCSSLSCSSFFHTSGEIRLNSPSSSLGVSVEIICAEFFFEKKNLRRMICYGCAQYGYYGCTNYE
jgi:hypothetical protein